QHFHEGGFTGAIFADKSVNFAFADLQVDVVEGFYARKRLRDATHFQKSLAHLPVSSGRPPSFRRPSEPIRSAIRRKGVRAGHANPGEFDERSVVDLVFGVVGRT